MTVDKTDQQQRVADPVDQATASPSASAVRRPYVTPQLRYLGKVAEMTFNGAGSMKDGGAGKFAKHHG